MKKYILFILIMFASYLNIFCDEIIYVVTQDTQLTLNLSSIAVKEGELLFFLGRIDKRRGEFVVFVKTELGNEGWINAKNILLQGNQSLPDLITDKLWIPNYFQKFLLGYPKETLFEYEPFWKDEYSEHIRDWGYDPEPWWQRAGNTRFEIKDNLFHVAGLYAADFISFATIEQRQEGKNIIIYALCQNKNNLTPQNHINNRFEEGKMYELTFKIDGDYMNLFVDNDTEPLVTLIGVDDYFLDSVSNFFHGREVDLSHIIWPRRADGSMDYLPPTQKPTEELVETTDIIIKQENVLAQESITNSKNTFIPIWLLITIVGGIAVIISFVLVVLRKKIK